MRPLGDRVIVLPIEEKEDNAFEVADSFKKAPIKGRVIAVGPGYPGFPMTVEADQTVLYPKHYQGDSYKHPGLDKEVLIMTERDILAIL